MKKRNGKRKSRWSRSGEGGRRGEGEGMGDGKGKGEVAGPAWPAFRQQTLARMGDWTVPARLAALLGFCAAK